MSFFGKFRHKTEKFTKCFVSNLSLFFPKNDLQIQDLQFLLGLMLEGAREKPTQNGKSKKQKESSDFVQLLESFGKKTNKNEIKTYLAYRDEIYSMEKCVFFVFGFLFFLLWFSHWESLVEGLQSSDKSWLCKFRAVDKEMPGQIKFSAEK